MQHHFPHATTPWGRKAFQSLPKQRDSNDGKGQRTVKEPRALQHRLRQQVREAETEAAVSQDLSLSMLAEEVAAEQRHALQHRLRHQLREAEAEAAVSQDLALGMLAGEVAAGERCALRHRQRGQMKGAAVEAEEPQNSV